MTDNIETILCPLQETGPGNLRNSEGSVVELRDGRLLLAYTHFYADADDFGAGDIRGKLSEDGGRTWSAPFLIEPNTARTNVGRLGLLRIPGLFDGYREQADCLAHIYVELNQFYANRILFKTSIDEGGTWSTPVQINDAGTLGHICQRGDTALVVTGGRILVPVYAMFGGLCASYMYYSDDGGDTWQRSRGEISLKLCVHGRDFAHADFEEPAVVELEDGRLLCLGRTRMGQLYKSYSTDRGATWGSPEPSGLASSYSPCSLKTIPSTGDVLCVWNQVSGEEIADDLGRMRMSCAVSKDGGETWDHFRNLESLDDTTRIEPEGGTSDSVSEINAIRERLALKAEATRTQYPDEVTRRYPRWPGYIHCDYPSVAFTRDDRAVFIYGASDYETAGLEVGLKLVIRPVGWLYE